VTSTSLYLGSDLAAWKRGSTWKLAGVTTDRVGVLVTTCPSCGTVRISLGGRVLGSIDLASPTVVHQQLLLLPRFPTASGDLTITVTSPDGRGVRIDGVLASRV
jgi:hypothetical protein